MKTWTDDNGDDHILIEETSEHSVTFKKWFGIGIGNPENIVEMKKLAYSVSTMVWFTNQMELGIPTKKIESEWRSRSNRFKMEILNDKN